jgi:hypothetical protein
MNYIKWICLVGGISLALVILIAVFVCIISYVFMMKKLRIRMLPPVKLAFLVKDYLIRNKEMDLISNNIKASM